MYYFILISILNLVLSKKSIEELRILNRPNNIKNELYCASCYIVVSTCADRMKLKYDDTEIIDIVSNSHVQKKKFYSKYEYFNSRMLRDACEIFSVNWDFYLEKYFKKLIKINRNNNKYIFDKLKAVEDFCYLKTKACENVWDINLIETYMLIKKKEDL